MPRRRWTIWIDPLDYRCPTNTFNVVWEIALDCGYSVPTIVEMSSEYGIYDFATFYGGNVFLS
jgi:hypothetical protein